MHTYTLCYITIVLNVMVYLRASAFSTGKLSISGTCNSGRMLALKKSTIFTSSLVCVMPCYKNKYGIQYIANIHVLHIYRPYNFVGAKDIADILYCITSKISFYLWTASLVLIKDHAHFFLLILYLATGDFDQMEIWAG